MAILSSALDGLEQPSVMPVHVRRVTPEGMPTKAMLDWEEFTHFFYKAAVNGIDTRVTEVAQTFTDELLTTNARITVEEIARADAFGALARRIDTVEASYQTADADIIASIVTETTARVNSDEAFAQQLQTIEADYVTRDGTLLTTVNSLLTSERLAWSTSDQALGARIDTIDVAYKLADTNLDAELTARVNAEQVARANALEAVAQDLIELEADFNARTDEVVFNVNADLSEERTVRSAADEALSQRIVTLTANYQSADAQNAAAAQALVTSEQQARATAIDAVAAQINTLQANFQADLAGQMVTTNALVSNEAVARAAADSAVAARTSTLEVQMNSPSVSNNLTWGRILTEEGVRAQADASLAFRSSQLEASMYSPNTSNNHTFARIVQLESVEASHWGSTVSWVQDLYAVHYNQESRLQVVAQASSTHGVRFGVNGYINGSTGGFVFTGLLRNDGSVQYNMEFWSNVTIYGDLLVTGSINSDKYQYGSISQMVAGNDSQYPGGYTYCGMNVRPWAKVLVTAALTDTTFTRYNSGFTGSVTARYFPITANGGAIAYLVASDVLCDFQYLGGSAYNFFKVVAPTAMFAVWQNGGTAQYVSFGIGNAGPNLITQYISATEITG
jgi:hypothetical protein